MYQSLEELCQLEEQENKPFWKIVQEDDCREQGISEQENFERMRGMYLAMKKRMRNTMKSCCLRAVLWAQRAAK